MLLTYYKSIPLLNKNKHQCGGRNVKGKITVRHRGGGHKKNRRIIDWSRRLGSGIAIGFEYDPNRNVPIVKLYHKQYKNKCYSYIIASSGIKLFQKVSCYLGKFSFLNQMNTNIYPGDCTFLSNFEPGDIVHSVEGFPGYGVIFARAAGTFCQIRTLTNISINNNQLDYFLNSKNTLANSWIKVRMPSGIQRLVSSNSCATRGSVSKKVELPFTKKKAGYTRWLGWRPSVRGVARNPVDHPHGGGQGKTSGGRPSVTFKAWPTKGQPTRKIKRTNSFIIKSTNKSIFN